MRAKPSRRQGKSQRSASMTLALFLVWEKGEKEIPYNKVIPNEWGELEH